MCRALCGASDLASCCRRRGDRGGDLGGRGAAAVTAACDPGVRTSPTPADPSKRHFRIAPLATVGDIATTGLPHELPVSGIASAAQNVVEQTGLRSFLEHTVSAILVPASLSALAAVALPGVGGLLIICAIGMRFGYRQAKALLAVRRAGIACFAGPGPLGVVRSGSLIALRPRASRVARPQTARAASPVEQAA